VIARKADLQVLSHTTKRYIGVTSSCGREGANLWERHWNQGLRLPLRGLGTFGAGVQRHIKSFEESMLKPPLLGVFKVMFSSLE
jgi:hypothetical protein